MYENTMYRVNPPYNAGMQYQNNNMQYQGIPYQNMTMMWMEDVDEEIITFSEALDLIRKSIENEREDEIFYNRIIELAPTEEDKDLIRGIRDDEMKHNNILKYLYYTFTGMIPRETRIGTEESSDYARIDSNLNRNAEYIKMLKEAWLGEFVAAKKYRKILGAMPDQKSRTLVNSILTDEILHANKYNYLLTK